MWVASLLFTAVPPVRRAGGAGRPGGGLGAGCPCPACSRPRRDAAGNACRVSRGGQDVSRAERADEGGQRSRLRERSLAGAGERSENPVAEAVSTAQAAGQEQGSDQTHDLAREGMSPVRATGRSRWVTARATGIRGTWQMLSRYRPAFSAGCGVSRSAEGEVFDG